MMKRLTIVLVTLLLCVSSMTARPAHKAAVKVQQPDGTYVTIRLHGDEWRSFNTTDDGYSVVKDSRGYYVYAELKDGQLEATAQVAHDLAERTASELAFLSGVQKMLAPEMTAEKAEMKAAVEKRQQETLRSRRATSYNNFRGLLILIEFNDRSFSREDYPEILNDMVNKEGYTGYGNQKYTGSVRDYFSDNSFGKFTPEFDVYGPYKVNYSQYYPDGSTASGVGNIIRAALNAADADINFADYDRDGDGNVDLAFFMLAGYGSCYTGNDKRLWWPHRSQVNIRKDGVYIYDYASSVEFYGWEDGTFTIDGIGTICHEFSHVLGLPDFYDTDYEKSGGQSNDPGEWSLMANGTDANYGRTPVGYSLYERWFTGFIDDIPEIDAEGSYQLEPLYKEGQGYRINSSVNNEFFLFENRQTSGFKWDASLPASGMLVHRVDKTNNSVWYNNTVNCNPSHNYYEVIRAGGSGRRATYDVFPGTGRVTELHNATLPANLKTWAGKSTKWGLTNIKMSNKVVSFDIGNTFVLKSLSLPQTMTIGAGLSAQLEATANPDYAEYMLTWSSSNNKVATVDQAGNVKGVAAGKAKITVKSDNGLSASCEVTVEALNPVDVAEFKQLEVGEETLLKLENAEVLYVYENTAYIRDAKGCIMFSNTGLNLKKNDRVSGTLVAKLGQNNNILQVVGIDGSTNDSGLTIKAGAEVQPREVNLEDLTEADYSDYVVVKAAQLKKDGGVWATSGDARAKVVNKFQDKSITVASGYDGKYFDIPAIYGTDVLNNEVVNELYMVKSPTQVDAPTGISVLSIDSRQTGGALYNMQGQRVGKDYKGLIIKNGKKILNK